jgi:hypothetical protein
VRVRVPGWAALAEVFVRRRHHERLGVRCLGGWSRASGSRHCWTTPIGRGPDVPWNRTTLCAWHHQRGVHGGLVRISGRAPDGLLYDLRVGRLRSGDVRVRALGASSWAQLAVASRSGCQT